MNKSYPPEFRLRSKEDFAGLRRGYRLTVDGIHIVYRQNQLSHARLGKAVSRKYGNAVQRNIFKRHAKEVFRQHGIRNHSVDILMMPSHGQSAPISDISSVIRLALDRLFSRLSSS